MEQTTDRELVGRFIPPVGSNWVPTGDYDGPLAVYCVALDQPALADGRGGPLSEVEQALAARFRTARLALRYRATHAALRLILGARCGRAAASLAFATLAHGKPILCREPGDPPITFNLSHSGPIALIAVGLDQEIGVDVEALRPFAGMSSLAGQVLTAEEAASFRAEAEAKQLGAFYARWTAKEAAIKALGFGLALEPSLFSVEPAGFSASDAATPHAAALRRLALLPLAPLYGYAGALVVTAPLPEVALRRWPH